MKNIVIQCDEVDCIHNEHEECEGSSINIMTSHYGTTCDGYEKREKTNDE